MRSSDQAAKEKISGTEQEKTAKMKLTGLEKSWIAYDIGNSAFTLLSTTIMPLFFNALADEAGITSDRYLAYWGYATSVTTVIVALLGPVLGTMADTSGSKKKIFFSMVVIGLLALLALALPLSWLSFLIFFVIARVGYQASLVFYDAMLTDITSYERMDRVSGYGFALGYIASCVPFILSLLVVLNNKRIGISLKTAITAAIIINAVWWLIFTIPLLRRYEQRYFVSEGEVKVSKVFKELFHTTQELGQDKRILFFLLAFFFYIDGVYTIIDMAVAYGSSIGLDGAMLLIALLVTQIVAFPFALLFGYLTKHFSNHALITVCIAAYTGIAAFAIQLDQVWEFWFLAICVGMFQGGIQALSRSYFAQLIPREKSGKYFGVYDIFGKGAAFMGTTLVAAISHATGDQSRGISAIVFLFIIGFVLFRYQVRIMKSNVMNTKNFSDGKNKS